MENTNLLDEQKYQENAKKLKRIGKTILIIGIIIFIVGIVMTFVGFLGFGSSAIDNMNSDVEVQARSAFGNFGLFAIGGFVDTLGFGLIGIGAIITFVAHRREITAFTAQQVIPVAGEAAEKIAPTVGKVAKDITKGIKEGLNEADKK